MRSYFMARARPIKPAPKINPHPGMFRCLSCNEMYPLEQKSGSGWSYCKKCHSDCTGKNKGRHVVCKLLNGDV